MIQAQEFGVRGWVQTPDGSYVAFYETPSKKGVVEEVNICNAYLKEKSMMPRT